MQMGQILVLKIKLLGKLNEMLESESTKFNITIFGLLLAAAAVPIFMVKIPALLDYFNHLARMHIIASVEDNPYLAEFYEIKWGIVSNMGMELVVPFLAKFCDIYLAGKIFVFFIMVLITTGIYAIHYSIYKQLSLAPLLAFLFLYNTALLYGLLNYLFGLGIALWGIAFWIGIRGHHPGIRLPVSLVFVLALFLCHLYAVGLYGLTIFCYELWMLKEKTAKNTLNMVTDIAVLTVPFIIVMLLLINSPTGGLAGENTWLLKSKFRAIEWIIELYHPYRDRMIGALIAGASIWSLGRGIFRIHPVGWITLIMGVFLFILMPTRLFTSWTADVRLPIAIIFIVIGFSHWKLPNISYRAVFVIAVFVIVLIRFVDVGKSWVMYDQVYAEIRKSFTYIKPGSSLLRVTRKPFRPYRKAWPLHWTNCLAVIDQSVFTPDLYTEKDNNILAVKSKYKELSDMHPFGNFLVSELVQASKNSNKKVSRDKYWTRFKSRFDYLLVLCTRKDDVNPLPKSLELVYQGKVFQLYSIKPST